MWAIAASAAAAIVAASVPQAPVKPRPAPKPPRSDCKGCGAPLQILAIDTSAMPALEEFDRQFNRYRLCSYCKLPSTP